MSDTPAVSVVMSVYNGADGLSTTIKSIRQQTFQDFEVIIVDDASRDETWQILTNVDLSRLRLHRNTTNRGQTACLNQAIDMARGRYIARHDAQDSSEKTRFEEQVRFLAKHPKVAMVGSQVEWVDGLGRLVRTFDYPTSHEQLVARLKQKNSFAHGSIMIRRDVLVRVGKYREAFRLAQDYDLWLRISEIAKVANLPQVLYRMRFSARMASVARNAEQSAYAALARKLAEERVAGRAEQTDLAEAAVSIERAHTKRNWLPRRIERSQNYVNWAERLLWWGPPSDRYAWALWSYALTTFPLNTSIWKFAFRQLMANSRGPASEKPEG